MTIRPGVANAWEPTQTVSDQRELALEHTFSIAVGPTARARTLGFDDLVAYLTDRYGLRRWSQWRIGEEIGLSQDWISRLLRAHGIPASVNILPGSRHQAWARVKFGDRLANLGFESLDSYLLDRYRDRGYWIGDLQAELGCGRTLLRTALHRLGIMRSPHRGSRDE
jgi:hypothetical protein